MLIKEINNQVNENFVDIEVKMVLQKVITDGKITDGAQISVLITMMNLMASGNIGTISDFGIGQIGSVELVAKVKGMSDAEVVKLVTEILEILENKDLANRAKLSSGDAQPNIYDWIKMTHRGNH